MLESGAQIVSGTPGRVFDMIKRRSLDTRDMKILVLDEADEMLNKGFREQIYDVYRYLPPDIQVILVSATLPHDVLEMTHKFMQDPVRVLVKRDELTLEVQKLLVSRDKPLQAPLSMYEMFNTLNSLRCIPCYRQTWDVD